MRSIFAPMAALLLALSGCGADDRKSTDTDKDPNGNGTNTAGGASEYEDEEVAGEAVSAQVDEGASLAVEDMEGGDALALYSADAAKTRKLDRSRDCVEQDPKAIVTIKRHGLFEREFNGPVRSASTKREDYRELVRTWSKDGASVKCAENKKYVALKPADMQGVTLNAKGKRFHEHSASMENKQKQSSLSRSRKANAEFDRTISWSSVKADGDNFVIEKTVNATSKRTLAISIKGSKDGKEKSVEKSFSSDVTVKDLKVTTVREADGDFLSRTLNGTIEAENTHGSSGKVVLVKTTFVNAKYERGKGCQFGGEVTGSKTEKGETEPFLTYSAKVVDDQLVISIVNKKTGKSSEVERDLTCDLDEEASEGADVKDVSADEIEKPASAS